MAASTELLAVDEELDTGTLAKPVTGVELDGARNRRPGLCDLVFSWIHGYPLRTLIFRFGKQRFPWTWADGVVWGMAQIRLVSSLIHVVPSLLIRSL